jgi:hypothetical protein
LSTLILLLVAEGLNGASEAAKSSGEFQGISISPLLRLTHILFVDDGFFYNGHRGDDEKLQNILELFCRVTGMRINERKSTLSVHNLEEEDLAYYISFYPYEVKEFDSGLKY